MPRLSRLEDAINKKVIIAGLFSNRFCEVPVRSTCRFQTKPFLGHAIKCDHPLDIVDIEAAQKIIANLHRHIHHEYWLDSESLFAWEVLPVKLRELALHLLCEYHDTEPNVRTLGAAYLGSIQRQARNEVSNAESVLQTATDKFTKPLFDELKERQNTEAPAWEEPASNKQRKRTYNQSSFVGDDGPARGSGSGGRKKKKQSHQQAQTNSPFVYKDETNYDQTPGPFKKDFETYEEEQSNDREQSRTYSQFYEQEQRRTAASIPKARRRTRAAAADNPPKAWSAIINGYLAYWGSVEQGYTVFEADTHIFQLLSYPVYSGLAIHVSDVNVSQFYERALQHVEGDGQGFLKKERLRWHPDKIDQRFQGYMGCSAVKELANVIIRQINKAADDLKQVVKVDPRETSA